MQRDTHLAAEVCVRQLFSLHSYTCLGMPTDQAHTHTHTHTRPSSTSPIACRSPLQSPCHRGSCVVVLVLLSTGVSPLPLLCTSTAPAPLPLFLPSSHAKLCFKILQLSAIPILCTDSRVLCGQPHLHGMCRYCQAQPSYLPFTRI